MAETKTNINHAAVDGFLYQYGRVFDQNGDILLCGREETARLIRAANLADPDGHDGLYGDEATGIMDPAAIVSLRDEVLKICYS